jgi:hypothetical protein
MEREDATRDLDEKSGAVEAAVRESRTLTGLAQIEAALSDFYKSERRIPRKLDELVPKFLAEVPSVETGVRGHKDTAAVQYYVGEIIRDGQIDGSRIDDTGKWGYAQNERQVIVFVDCTHQNSKGVPWYQVRGVF